MFLYCRMKLIGVISQALIEERIQIPKQINYVVWS